MAREFIDGFESRGLDLWDGRDSNGGALVSVAGLVIAGGSYGLQVQSTDRYLWRGVTARDEYYVAFKLNRYNNDAEDRSILKFLNGSTVLGTLNMHEYTNSFKAYRGNSSTLLAQGTFDFGVGNEALIEIRYKPATDSTGYFVVKVNGTTDINVALAQTANNALQIDTIRIGDHRHVTYDDFVVESADWIGDTRILGIVPSGAGTTTQWTPSTGSNYACVDETPVSDTDYNYTNTNDNIDLYAMGDTGLSGKTIKAVAFDVRLSYEGTPTPTGVKPVVRHSSTNYAGDTITTTTAYKTYQKIYETNPGTSSAWSISDIDAVELGVKAVA